MSADKEAASASAATMAASAAVSASLEELRKSAVPRYRQPGVCRRKRIICSETEWDRALQQLKDAMGEYRALGFDVECINMSNPRQFLHFQNQQEVEREVPSHFHRGYPPAVISHLPPRYQSFCQQFQEYQGRRSAFPSSAGEYADAGDDGRYSNRIKALKPTLQSPVLPTTPHSSKRRQEISVLIQLATWSGLVVMLRLCFWRSLPESLREFLSDPRYLKLGVGIDQDAARLMEDWGLVVRGWVDLRHLCVDLCVQFRECYSLRQMGLKKLAEGLFGMSAITLTMPMGFKKMRAIAWSDWNAVRLKEEQIRYAAWDAQIAVDIFSLATQRLYNLSAPQRESRSYYETLYEKCALFVDVPTSRHPRQPGDDDDESDDLELSKENSIAGDDEELRALYNNCRIHAQQTGNRGFRSAISPPPIADETSASASNNDADTLVAAEEVTLPATPTPSVEGSVRASSAAGSVDSKGETSIDRRSYCSVSISFMNKKSGIAILTVNNSPKNVLDFATVKSMIGNLRLLEDAKDCRAVILASACSNAFSVGFDLKEFRNAEQKRLRAYWAALMDLWFYIYKTRLATVAAINGVASGGGFVMAACCDRRIMASGCGGVGFTEAKQGIILPHWVIGRVSQLVGAHKGESILTRGQVLEAEHALEYGLVDRVTSKDRLLDAAADELEKLLETPDYPRVNTKRIMRQPLIDKVLQERERCLDLLTECITTSQTQELLRR